MSKKVILPIAILVATFALASCSMMAKMMGKGDLMDSMVNMDKVMKVMTPTQRAEHMKQKQMAMMNDGRQLFRDASLGKNGQSCESCHPGGGTTGGEAQIPMRDYRIPIPTLVGASARFPKYKVPNDRVITLAQMNNNCIRMFLDGKELELDSREAIALSMYISSLSNGESVQIGQAN